MTRTGILLHVYHLEAEGWEELVWGDPSADRLGTLARFAETLIRIPPEETVGSVIFSGPSSRDGLTEGAYARQFLLDHVDGLLDFPTLRRSIEALTADGYHLFIQRMEGLVAGPVITNTKDEVGHAAAYFRENFAADQVYQIAAASHAPRCLKNQIAARHEGLIPKDQPWYIIPSDTCYADIGVEDVVILEPPHRGDDPMTSYRPRISEVMAPYFAADAKTKQQLIKVIGDFFAGQDGRS